MIHKDAASLEAKVYGELQEAILCDALKKGEALTEISLSEKYGVSRTPVRSALRRLAKEGLVTLVPNKGAVVVGVTEEDLVDIYRIRMRLEGLASSMAASKMSDAEKKKLSETVELSEFYIERQNSEHSRELDSTFHQMIYEASGSRMLEQILSELHQKTAAYRKLSLSVPGRLERSTLEHREILNAILAGDADRADALTSKHIEHALSNMLKAFSKE